MREREWLTTVPMDEHAFALSRGDFRDAICLRYGWKPPHMPSHCSDGEPFTVEHALSCSHGGYVSLRHNEVRDLLTDLLSDTCKIVTAEPHLQPVCGERFQSSLPTKPGSTFKQEDFGVVNTRLRTSTSGC